MLVGLLVAYPTLLGSEITPHFPVFNSNYITAYMIEILVVYLIQGFFLA